MFARRMEGMSIITMENEGGRSSVSVTQERGEYAHRRRIPDQIASRVTAF